MSNTVVLASGNVGKLRELQDALAGAGFTLKPQSEFGVSDAVEDKHTFIENALIKARHASAETGLLASPTFCVANKSAPAAVGPLDNPKACAKAPVPKVVPA